jgi:hypothetical protein
MPAGLEWFCESSSTLVKKRGNNLVFLKLALGKSKKRLYYAAQRRGNASFPGSSAVEHSTVNRQVAGSNPARGAIFSDFIRVIKSWSLA